MINQSPEIITKLKSYISHKQGFLLLRGSNGTGKTFAAMKIYYLVTPFKLPERDNDLAIFTTQAELNIVWSQDIYKQHELLAELSKTKLLVLDDLGTRIPSDAFMDFLYALIDSRYTNREEKGTIITTNLTSEGIREKFGKAILSRIASGTVISIEGEDRRLNASKTNRIDLY